MTKLQSIEKEAVDLPEEDRAAPAAVRLNTFDGPLYDVDAEEISRRDEEMETGAEPGICHEELVRSVRPSGP